MGQPPGWEGQPPLCRHSRPRNTCGCAAELSSLQQRTWRGLLTRGGAWGGPRLLRWLDAGTDPPPAPSTL